MTEAINGRVEGFLRFCCCLLGNRSVGDEG